MTEPDDDRVRRRNSLIAMLVLLALLAAGLWLSDILAAVSRIQDCVMAGRHNCVVFH